MPARFMTKFRRTSQPQAYQRSRSGCCPTGRGLFTGRYPFVEFGLERIQRRTMPTRLAGDDLNQGKNTANPALHQRFARGSHPDAVDVMRQKYPIAPIEDGLRGCHEIKNPSEINAIASYLLFYLTTIMRHHRVLWLPIINTSDFFHFH